MGTGKLKPFEKGPTGSETIESSKTKNGPTRAGFFDNLMITRAGGPESQENPRVGLEGWRQKQEYVQDTSDGKIRVFHKRSNGIPTFPAFSKREVKESDL